MKCLFLGAGRLHPLSNKPAYMLTCPDGDYVIEKIVKTSGATSRDCVFAIREEDDARYDISESFREMFGSDITCISIKSDETAGPLETVVQTIESLSLTGPLLIRDTDSYFETELPSKVGNYVVYADLDDCPHVSARALSFIKLNDQGIILDIQERHAISNLFIAGAYGFEEASIIPKMYQRLRAYSPRSLYVSECVKECIFYNRDTFLAHPVKGFLDWGSEKGWQDWRAPQKTYFVDIDGVLCTCGGKSFKPRQLKAEPILENVEAIQTLAARGAQIIITTTRHEAFREATEQQLKSWGVPYSALVMDCLHQQRVLINDFAKTNPYPSAAAINIPRESKDLKRALNL
jgi:hypothetical protein